jgi:hypothetical protein
VDDIYLGAPFFDLGERKTLFAVTNFNDVDLFLPERTRTVLISLDKPKPLNIVLSQLCDEIGETDTSGRTYEARQFVQNLVDKHVLICTSTPDLKMSLKRKTFTESQYPFMWLACAALISVCLSYVFYTITSARNFSLNGVGIQFISFPFLVFLNVTVHEIGHSVAYWNITGRRPSVELISAKGLRRPHTKTVGLWAMTGSDAAYCCLAGLTVELTIGSAEIWLLSKNFNEILLIFMLSIFEVISSILNLSSLPHTDQQMLYSLMCRIKSNFISCKVYREIRADTLINHILPIVNLRIFMMLQFFFSALPSLLMFTLIGTLLSL